MPACLPRTISSAASPGSLRSTSPCAGTCTGCCPNETAGPAGTRPPRRPASPARWRPSTSTSWPTPASSRSPTSARRAGPGPGAGRPSKLYRPSDDEVSASVPERRYDLAGPLLAAAADESSRDRCTDRGLSPRPPRESTGRRVGEEARAAAGASAPAGSDAPSGRARRAEAAWLPTRARGRRRDRARQLPVPPARRAAPDARLRHEPRLPARVLDGLGQADRLVARLAPEPGTAACAWPRRDGSPAGSPHAELGQVGAAREWRHVPLGWSCHERRPHRHDHAERRTRRGAPRTASCWRRATRPSVSRRPACPPRYYIPKSDVRMDLLRTDVVPHHLPVQG